MAFLRQFILTLLCFQCLGQNLNSRMFFQSTEDGVYNLYEIKVKDTTFGKCSYKNKVGIEYKFEYEEKNGELATIDNKFFDPNAISSCREAAVTVRPLDYTPDFRNDGILPEKPSEDPFLNEIEENQQYLHKVRQGRILLLGKLGLLGGLGALAAAPAALAGAPLLLGGAALGGAPLLLGGAALKGATLLAADIAALKVLAPQNPIPIPVDTGITLPVVDAANAGIPVQKGNLIFTLPFNAG